MVFSDYLYYSAYGAETWKGNGTFYDPELGKSLYYELTYTHETGGGYYVEDFDLFSPAESGSMHEDDVLTSLMYDVVIPNQTVGTDRRFRSL